MKVLIFTEGGKTTGFGHITRCIALYQAFEKSGIYPNLIVNGDDSIKDLLKNKKHIIFNWLKEEKKRFNFVKDSNIIIIDSYLADIKCYKKISSLAKVSVYIDDNKRLNYPKGVVINGNIYAKRLNYPKKKSLIYLLGAQYAFLRKEFWKVPKKKINKEVNNILITFGGADYSDMIYKIINCLKNKFDFNFYIVDPKKKRIDVKEMLNLMLKTDICIAGGGQTLYELARIGVPTIAVAVGKDQLRNVKGWQKKGFIEYAGWWQNVNDVKIKNGLKRLLPQSIRLKRGRLGRVIIDGKGATRIISKLIRCYEKN